LLQLILPMLTEIDGSKKMQRAERRFTLHGKGQRQTGF